MLFLSGVFAFYCASVSFASLLLIILWFGYFGFLGRAVLPLVRCIFPNLPDGGLAAGRVLFLTLVGLVA